MGWANDGLTHESYGGGTRVVGGVMVGQTMVLHTNHTVATPEWSLGLWLGKRWSYTRIIWRPHQSGRLGWANDGLTHKSYSGHTRAVGKVWVGKTMVLHTDHAAATPEWSVDCYLDIYPMLASTHMYINIANTFLPFYYLGHV